MKASELIADIAEMITKYEDREILINEKDIVGTVFSDDDGDRLKPVPFNIT